MPKSNIKEYRIEYDSDLEKALTAKEAAAFLAVSPKTLANWRSQGQGPSYIKYGSTIDRKGRKRGSVVYLPSVLRSYRDAHCVEAGGEK